MLKMVGLLGLWIVAFALTGCGPVEPAAEAPAVEAPAIASVPPKRARAVNSPLPSSEAIAQDLVEAVADASKAQLFPAKPDQAFPGGVRVVPESKATIYPPTNAVAVTISATLEPDAWVHQAEYKTDGVAITIEAIGADGTSIAMQELVIDPAVSKQNDPPSTLSVAIPPEADHLDIIFSARENGALDNATVVLSYE